MENFTTRFDQQLIATEHYGNFYQMIPFVGAEYDSKEKRLLILGESHFLPNSSTVDLSEWYDLSIDELNEEEIEWTSTREIVNHGHNQRYSSRSHGMFKNTELAILESGFLPENRTNIFRYASFMNYFQRPAEEQGASINVTPLDNKIAQANLKAVIDIIKPTHIMVASKKAWDNLPWSFIDEYKGQVIFDFCPHPGTSWWNRTANAYGGLTGKEKFIKFIKDHNIF